MPLRPAYSPPHPAGQLRPCRCPAHESYPNITLLTAGLAFNITPHAYILGSYAGKNCRLGIEALPEGGPDFIVLGDLFFHDQVVLFDKERNRIGFVNSQRRPYLFPTADPFCLDVVFVLLLLSCGCILLRPNSNTSSLR